MKKNKKTFNNNNKKKFLFNLNIPKNKKKYANLDNYFFFLKISLFMYKYQFLIPLLIIFLNLYTSDICFCTKKFDLSKLVSTVDRTYLINETSRSHRHFIKEGLYFKFLYEKPYWNETFLNNQLYSLGLNYKRNFFYNSWLTQNTEMISRLFYYNPELNSRPRLYLGFPQVSNYPEHNPNLVLSQNKAKQLEKTLFKLTKIKYDSFDIELVQFVLENSKKKNPSYIKDFILYNKEKFGHQIKFNFTPSSLDSRFLFDHDVRIFGEELILKRSILNTREKLGVDFNQDTSAKFIFLNKEKLNLLFEQKFFLEFCQVHEDSLNKINWIEFYNVIMGLKKK